jgi:spore coat polysaccharide biosynthesis predicted glycosyltransferase SpsG
MSITRHMTVVFRVSAGPRRGFGHLARCRAIARALGVRPRISVRGTARTRAAAARLGIDVLPGGRRALASLAPVLLVVDDPSPRHAAPWVIAARRRGIRVAVLCDGGLGRVDADLVIDGSILADHVAADLAGPRYAVVDPRVTALRGRRRPGRRRICIAVGGGAHVFSRVSGLVAGLAALAPDADIRVAPGFTAPRSRPVLAAGRWIASTQLVPALAAADVAIVAGGLTAYEACALGVPAVAVSVVPAQQPAVRALARHGAVVDGGPLHHAEGAGRVSGRAAALLTADAARRQMAAAGRRLVDGRGATRIATALARLAHGGGRA